MIWCAFFLLLVERVGNAKIQIANFAEYLLSTVDTDNPTQLGSLFDNLGYRQHVAAGQCR